MNKMTFFHRHSLTGYFFLAFGIAWAGSFLAVGAKLLRGESIEFIDIGFMGVAMMAGPSLTALLMTYLVDGKLGLRNLFYRMRIWRVGGWYLALLIFPALILVVSLALASFVSSEFRPTFFGAGILMGLLIGLFEEAGWMGFAFPRMKSKYGLLGTSIYLGIFHGLWHLVADYLGNSVTLGVFWLPYFISFVAFVMALRILIDGSIPIPRACCSPN